jgi:hypothetical protein
VSEVEPFFFITVLRLTRHGHRERLVLGGGEASEAICLAPQHVIRIAFDYPSIL